MDQHRHRRCLMGLLALAALVLNGSIDVALAATESVDIVGTSFQPAQTEITVGDTVVWTNRSNTSHAVTIETGEDLQPTCAPGLLGPVGDCQGPGETAKYTFTTARNYPYHCKLHPSMRGVVVVAPAVATTTSATTSSTLPRATTTSSTAKASTSSSATATTKPLATSSTLASSSTTSTTADTSSVLLPGEPPPFGGDDASAVGKTGGSDDGSDSGTVALIVVLLLAVSAGGGFLLWRLRPGRA